MVHSSSKVQIQNPGSFVLPARLQALLVAFLACGVAAFAWGLSKDPARMYISFLHNHFYFMSLSLGGAFFAAIQWVTGAMWSAPVRRLSEAFTAYLPWVLITFLILCSGIPVLYLWSHPENVLGHPVLEGKSGYLNSHFFLVRNVIAIALWVWLSFKLVGNSLKQDVGGELTWTLKNRFWSPIFLIVFALSFTMASFDQLMSLDPTWFSTIFGVYCFSGLFYSVLAATCLLAVYLKSQGKLDGLVNQEHFHDMGKFMFAFTVFWAYIAFSQFMLIWYANLPEETIYFIKRFDHQWIWVSRFLVFGKFLVPFMLLMPQGAKRHTGMLAFVASFMLVAQWIDVLWMIQPEFYVEGPVFGLLELGITLGFIGLFGLVVFRFLGRHNIVAIGDPRLAESVFHHHT